MISPNIRPCKQNTLTPSGQHDSASELLNHPDLWQARQLAAAVAQDHASTQSSGYPALDAELAGGGWPRAGLTEILHGQQGLGELQILAPALAALSAQENRWVAWIQPPAVPYAPALEQLGINSERMLMIHPKTHADALWAAEQALGSGNCSAVLIWLDETQLKHQHTRRLQIAAKRGSSLACLFRHTSAQQQASAAQLRIAVKTPAPDSASGTGHTTSSNWFFADTAAQRIHVDIIKRRGGWGRQAVELQLHANDPVQQEHALHEQLSMWQSSRSPTPLASGSRTTFDTNLEPNRLFHELDDESGLADEPELSNEPNGAGRGNGLERSNAPDYIKRLSDRLEQVRLQRAALLENSPANHLRSASRSAGYRLH